MRALLCVVLFLAQATAWAATAAGDRHFAEQVVKTRCAMCHGADGQSLSPQYPKLAAQSPEYLVKQLFNFKTGQRPSTVMQEMTNQLSAAEIRALADYYSLQRSAPQRDTDLELAAVGRYIYFRGNPYSKVSACVTCHGVYAGGSAQLPRLAGQHAAYLETQLNNFRQKLRVNDQAMHSVVAALTEFEIKAVAQYLASQE